MYIALYSGHGWSPPSSEDDYGVRMANAPVLMNLKNLMILLFCTLIESITGKPCINDYDTIAWSSRGTVSLQVRDT